MPNWNGYRRNLGKTDKDKILDNVAKTTGYNEYKFENLPIYEFADCPISQKLKYPLFAVALRTMAFGKRAIESFPQAVLDGFSIFGSKEGNAISNKPMIFRGDTPNPYEDVDYSLNGDEFVSVFKRMSYRHGFILNTEELASLVHFPSKALKHPKLLRQNLAFAKAPEANDCGRWSAHRCQRGIRTEPEGLRPGGFSIPSCLRGRQDRHRQDHLASEYDQI